MHPSPLRRLFARTLRASLAPPLVLVGCGGGTGGDVSIRDVSSNSCESRWLSLEGLSAPEQPDFIQLREIISRGGLEGPVEPSVTAQVSSGTPCASASHPEACQKTLSHLTSPSGFHKQCFAICADYYLATTRGDQVTALTTLESLRSFLGPIDTPPEALLMVLAEGYDVACDSLPRGLVHANEGAQGGFQVIATTGFACGPGTELRQFVLNVASSGEVSEVSSTVLERGDPSCSIGRRPVGLCTRESVMSSTALGHHFALVAHLEAASIQAFLRLHDELLLHGADEALREAALRSAVDEVFHTDVSTRLAQGFGATPPRPAVAPRPLRPLFEVALDNAVEGCTRETYGALVAHHQALHAGNTEIRASMARIAEDETRHAELSWALERWALPRLSEAERAALKEARRRAVAVLRQEVAAPLEAELVTQAGLPPPERAVSWVSALERELWA